MRLTDIQIRNLKAPEAGAKVYYDDTLKGFGLRVSHAGTKAFILATGKNRDRTTIGRYPTITLAEARDIAKKLLAERTLGRHQEPKTTLGAALDLFAEQHTAKLAPRTHKEMGRLFTRHLTKLRTKKLADITTRDITSVTDKTAPSEGEHFHRACKTFFRWCVRRRMLQHSPIEGLELPSKWKPRERVLTDEELRTVWRAADDLGGTFSGIVKLLILTGQRRGEIASLKGEWCSLPSSKDGVRTTSPAPLAVGGENTGLIVHRLIDGVFLPLAFVKQDTDCEVRGGESKSATAGNSAPREGHFIGSPTNPQCTITLPSEHTKNRRSHTFPLGQLSSTLIQGLLGSSRTMSYLFAARGTENSPRPFAGWSKAKVQLDEKIIEFRQKDDKFYKLVPWTLHDLRRTYATNLQRLGVKLEVIEALLNHISGTRAGIVGVYQVHRYEAEMREAVTIFENWFTRYIVGGGHEPSRLAGSPAAHAGDKS